MQFISNYSLWETSQTLFWAIFGLVDLDNFELTGIKEFTRFFGLLMFGSFSVINVIVLLNLLIAMMNHSYQLISVSSVCIDLIIILINKSMHYIFPDQTLCFCFYGLSNYVNIFIWTKHTFLDFMCNVKTISSKCFYEYSLQKR